MKTIIYSSNNFTMTRVSEFYKSFPGSRGRDIFIERSFIDMGGISLQISNEFIDEVIKSNYNANIVKDFFLRNS